VTCLAALAWVRDNVGAFGGDPDNLTLFGESGGAMAVADLVTSPLAAGLFTRAVVQSGNGSSVYSRDVAELTVHRLARLLGVAPDVEGFRATTFEAGLAAVAKINRPGALDLRDDEGFESLIGLNRFNPVLGDDVLPVHPLQALRDGAGRDVELLIGATSEEANSWFVPTRIRPLLPGWVGRRLLGRGMPRASEAYDAYRTPGRRGGDVLCALITDLAFRGPAREYAAAHSYFPRINA
jgi:para-nitrobenzyl esterase